MRKLNETNPWNHFLPQKHPSKIEVLLLFLHQLKTQINKVKEALLPNNEKNAASLIPEAKNAAGSIPEAKNAAGLIPEANNNEIVANIASKIGINAANKNVEQAARLTKDMDVQQQLKANKIAGDKLPFDF